MNHSHVSVELALLLPLVGTKLTRVSDAEMFIIYMSLHHFPSSNLVITFVTGEDLALVFLLDVSRGVGLE